MVWVFFFFSLQQTQLLFTGIYWGWQNQDEHEQDRLKAKYHIVKTISSTIEIIGRPETIWDNITNVKIEKFSDPAIFKLLDIPKPLRAEIISEGQGGKRIAYFDSDKTFIQEILVWKP